MTTALDKLARLTAVSATDDEDCAGALVGAAWGNAAELFALLADSDGDDDKDNDGEDGDEDGGHSGHATFKALVKKGVPAARASKMCAQADRRVKATELAEAIMVALDGLAAAPGDWVEDTALDTWTVAMAGETSEGGPKKPYGNVTYADPGYQKDGKKRYPLDTEAHVRAALSYINHSDNAAEYSSGQLASIKSKIKAAARRLGIEVSGDDDGEKAAATMLALAARLAGGAIPMSHGPFTGTHSHAHFQSSAHDHDHQPHGDNSHDGGPLHRAGSKAQRGYM